MQITLLQDAKPLRKDAERNRRRILDAARELFARRGLGVTLNDIAHHAGVGVGTVYRRFPDKSQLIDDLFEERVQELVALGEAALADPDPWHGLTTFLEHASALQAEDRALRDIVCGTPDGAERVGHIRDRLLPLGMQLVRRAQAEGRLRADVSPTDMPVIQLMIGAIIDASRDVEPELWRRYLALVIGGLAAEPGDAPPLSPGPLAPHQIDTVMSAARVPRP
ncbi:MAG: TetR/AcrR family transcriptional regulator [Solirubrobacteraceae bacterium]